MGVAGRHIGRVLREADARTGVLVALSNGKPEGQDRLYLGEYGLEDTRQPLFEAGREGGHPYCLTLDGSHTHVRCRK